MSIVIILSSRLINELLFDNSIAYSIFLIPALLMTKALYSQANLYYRFTSRISIMTVMSLMYGYLDIAVILFCFYYLKSISINILLFSQSFVGLGIGVVSFYFIIRDINIRFIFYKLKELYLDIKIGFPLILNMIIDFILSGSDRYFIALYISVASVGYYSTGYMLGTLIILLPKAMGGALPQLLSRAIDLDDNRSVDLLLNYSVKIFIIIAIPYIAATTVISLPILSILANIDVAQRSYQIPPVVATGALFYGLSLIFTNLLFVNKKTLIIFKMNLIASIFNIIANALLLLVLKNIMLAAITTVISYFIAFLYAYSSIKRYCNMQIKISYLVKTISSATIMGISLQYLQTVYLSDHSISNVLFLITIGTAVYIPLILLFKTISTKEIRFIKNMFNGGA